MEEVVDDISIEDMVVVAVLDGDKASRLPTGAVDVTAWWTVTKRYARCHSIVPYPRILPPLTFPRTGPFIVLRSFPPVHPFSSFVYGPVWSLSLLYLFSVISAASRCKA